MAWRTDGAFMLNFRANLAALAWPAISCNWRTGDLVTTGSAKYRRRQSTKELMQNVLDVATVAILKLRPMNCCFTHLLEAELDGCCGPTSRGC